MVSRAGAKPMTIGWRSSIGPPLELPLDRMDVTAPPLVVVCEVTPRGGAGGGRRPPGPISMHDRLAHEERRDWTLRQLGTLPKERDPKVFADYLLTLGMKTRVDERPRAGACGSITKTTSRAPAKS